MEDCFDEAIEDFCKANKLLIQICKCIHLFGTAPLDTDQQ